MWGDGHGYAAREGLEEYQRHRLEADHPACELAVQRLILGFLDKWSRGVTAPKKNQNLVQFTSEKEI